MTDVAFYFDVMCPWAHQTARWMREVREHGDVAVDWRFFSLEEAGWEEGKKHAWERPWTYGWSLLRIAAHLRRSGGNDEVARFYEIAGGLLHERGIAVHTPAGAKEALAAMGAPASTLDSALADDTTNDEVRREHDAAVALGVHGVPTLVIDEQVLYGPTMAPAPTGERALELWDQVLAWTRLPELYEIQRPRRAAEQATIARVFEPYRIARGWMD